MFLKLQITAPNCFMYREFFLDCSPALPTFSSSHSAIILTKINFLYTRKLHSITHSHVCQNIEPLDFLLKPSLLTINTIFSNRNTELIKPNKARHLLYVNSELQSKYSSQWITNTLPSQHQILATFINQLVNLDNLTILTQLDLERMLLLTSLLVEKHECV